ncbi:membrane protein [Paenibacillus sp. J23TS9]|uniref:permease n=1 Tax=Paenibacillus sp. J23TS9 TaxID=2807193 RepID=UPI001B15FE39|nr:permease [Paenibacillus sp. J23TS9]GIP26920.1 membrane protein [Paenibacillus sp. J23TS9]
MSPVHSTTSRPPTKKTFWLAMLFVLIAIIGLLYVKWWPYYHKAFSAASKHSIGSSILGMEQDGPSWHSALQYAKAYFKSVWKAAVLGILLGSLVQVLLPVQWLYQKLGKAGFKSTLIGGVSSLPGMMCTCCAAPIASGLRKRNVSIGAALAFWLGNPLLNPATLIFMAFVLSWKFTLMRIVFGLVVTFGVSYFANRFAGKTEVNGSIANIPDETAEQAPFLTRWLKSLGTMIISVVPAYLIAVLLLGAFQSNMFPVWVSGGIAAIIVFAIVGTLFVIPTAAEIPIIQSFLMLGIGTGPAAALLVTLPAISLPSVLIVGRAFPKKVLAFVIGSVVVAGFVSGLIGAWIL